jgi:IclR family pca regulon transcriptional regulator
VSGGSPQTPRTGGAGLRGWVPPGVPEGDVGHLSASLARGLSILQCFTPQNPVWDAAGIAVEFGMGQDSARRYLTTLAVMGYLTQLPDQGRHRVYRLGLRVTDLGLNAINSTGLQEHARLHLRRLRQSCSYTATLAVLDGPQAVIVERVPSHRRAQSIAGRTVTVGSRLPVHATALGKILLAHLPADERSHLIEETVLTEHTPTTFTNRKALRTELAEIRRAGFALSDEEYAMGLVAIAAPVRNITGQVVAAVGVDTHTSETSIEELRLTARSALHHAAEGISKQLGYREREPA